MNSQKLNIGDFGDEVANLHNNLKKHGLNVSAAEIKRKFFGPSTREVVGEFQKIHGIDSSCEVCDKTAALLIASPIKPIDEVTSSETRRDADLHKTIETDTGIISDPKHLNPTLSDISDTGSDQDIESDTSDNQENRQDFFMRDARNKKRLDCLKRCKGSKIVNEKLDDLFRKAEGNIPEFKKLLNESTDFDEVAIRQLDFANDLADLTEDDDVLVDAFLAHNKTHCLKDVALNLKKDEFKSIIGQTAEAADREKKANELHDRLFRMAPTAVIERMTRDNELEMEHSVKKGLLDFLKTHPDLDFNKDSVLKILNEPESLKKIPENCREGVIHSLKCCQRLAAISPTAEALPVLMKAELNSAHAITEIPLQRFVALYSDALGGENVARMIHTRAQQIEIRNQHALAVLRDAMLSPSVNMIHGGQSSAARMEFGVTTAQQKGIPINFETLFGSVDLCECKHCNSVYSPAAYLVELFQYLRNNNLDPYNPKTGAKGINHTPLQMLFRRRPDLGFLQLTCENTHTLIPYIDLVNEVMESFIANLDRYEDSTHKPKQARIAVHNVDEESSGELLAEAQHTNYRAYRILSKTVYPVCKLPYHQPIDAIRQYLNFLKTSHHELFSTFRKDVSFELKEGFSKAEAERLSRLQALQILAVDRAIAAEYFHLTEEEYVILTKEGFHTKEWYELDQQADVTWAQYHNKIGLKDTWAYYGIDTNSQMFAELKWVKPAQETGMVGFLRRINLQYVDLIELLKTRYINPNYLSGHALVFMNSLPYSYRYLHSLVDENQTDLKLKYKRIVQLLETELKTYANPIFSKEYAACWVHKYFAKIGKLIVLENSSPCKCTEGRFQLPALHKGDDAGTYIDLILNSNCQIHLANSNPRKWVGHLNTDSGKIELDHDFLENYSSVIAANIPFNGINGESGYILDWILYTGTSRFNLTPFTCGDHKDTCDISKTQLKHLDGTDLVLAEYDRLHRFIRLWCKLGWSIAEVDLAISGVGETVEQPFSNTVHFIANKDFKALDPPQLPEDDDIDIVDVRLAANHSETGASLARNKITTMQPARTTTATVDNRITANLPVIKPEKDCKPEPVSQVLQEITPYLIEQLVAVKKLQEMTGLDLAQLLVFWTAIGTQDENSLYKKLFLKYNLIAADQIFKEEADAGTYLIRHPEEVSQVPRIKDHLPALMAAMKVDVAMLEKIMAYVGIADKLTLANISHIYRHVLLAKSLGLRVLELPALIDLLKNQRHPFSKPTDTLEFYQLFERIENSGFDRRELNYILRNEDDPVRPLQPGNSNLFRLAINLRNTLLQIDIDHADIKNDEEATKELLSNKLSLLFDDSVVTQIINLVQGATVYQDTTRRKYTATMEQDDRDAIISSLMSKRKLEENAPGGDFKTFLQKVQFSGERGLQVTGILSEPDQNRLRSLADDLKGETEEREKFLIAVNKLLKQAKLFFDDALAAIFPEEAKRVEAENILLAEDTVDSSGTEISAIQKRAYLLRAFLPYLREQLSQRQVTQILSSELGLDQDLTLKLMMDVIKTENDEMLYAEITRLKQKNDRIEENQDVLAIWDGYFVPSQEGQYVFLLETEGEGSLTFNEQANWLKLVRTDEEKINFYRSKPTFLKAGQTYPFHLQGYDEDESGKVIGLYMRFNDQPQTLISDKHLFPALRTEAFIKAYLRLHKAAMLINGFKMKLAELAFFAEFQANFDGLDFNALSFSHWLRLEAFYRLQKSLTGKQLNLIEFLRWTNTAKKAVLIPSLSMQINRLTGWREVDVAKLIATQNFNLAHPKYFHDEVNLLKLQNALSIEKRVGVGIDLLFQWGSPTSQFSKNRTIAGGIREAIRARYTQEEWEKAIKPLHDRLRENQKQALIAYLLAQPVLLEWGVRDADSLFEFFLIDVQMDACMETSRIKQAISSVQLFIQRCFLGLEDKHGVLAGVLERQRWEWMSRYRVWEANRKVFLYPENWIRPELRDDKSPFFKELESELLQNDVSEDTVKSALTKYIVQVDEVANLEVVGQFVEGEDEFRKIHVIGRTRNTPHFFYYRYYEFETKNWYPWEKIEVDIPAIDIKNRRGEMITNGVFVMPVVWKDRLFIFFPQLMPMNWDSPLKQNLTIKDSAGSSSRDSAPLTYWEIKMAWSEYKEGKWTPKQISTQAIYTLRELNPETINKNSKEQTFNLLQQIEKFIFAPFVNNGAIFIQPYYLADFWVVTEHLEKLEEKEEDKEEGDGEEGEEENSEGEDSKITYFYSRNYKTQEFYHDNPSLHILPQSFGFDGNQILKLNDRVSNVLPHWWNGQNHFHRMGTSIVPIQAIDTDNPAIKWAPMFTEKGEENTVFLGHHYNNEYIQEYAFQHTLTKEMLGVLRKGEMKSIFDNKISLSDDNYGSNDFGISYHELNRPYAIYNWEALFHAVALLADNLSKSQRFEEAMAWWHYIFDPINVKDDIKGVWRFLPFRTADSKHILEEIFNRLDPNSPDKSGQIPNWRNNPFQPHVIARDRPTAYMKWVIMRYIDNLIAWGDSLFRQDTIESINQATQLYILAGHILGPRPEFIPKRGKIQPKSYLDLVDQWDAFSNTIVDLELIFPFSNQIAAPTVGDDESHYINLFGFSTSLYFCIPDNPKLLEYWDTVADRLFKIRHCRNIEGIFRKLDLFEPPIDPALLVQATAQGLSIGSVLNDLSTPMPNYRFNYLLERALVVTSEVKSLGNALLSALEKKDSEGLSLLRAKHDTNLQNLIKEVRKKQLEESEKTKESLEENRKAPAHRLEYYQKLVDEEVNVPDPDTEFAEIDENLPSIKQESGMKLIGEEAEEIKKAKQSRDLQSGVVSVEALAAVLWRIPGIEAKMQPLGMGLGFKSGGQFLGAAERAVASTIQKVANFTSAQSTAAARKAGHLRQLYDRKFQANLAGYEIKQIDKQITTQEIRCQLAQNEIDNHQVQIDQTKEAEEFLKNKFSNEQLYHWMSEQLRNLYYQTYSFAYDLAKKAEKVYRFDMGLPTSDFIKFGYWNSSKEGFLAGEQLHLALMKLQHAYIESNSHDYEITKPISLRQINPLALIQLKEQGVCEFNLPEELFDLDYPGHYKRRIKTVALSIPCIVGPHTSLNCTLRLLKHEYRNSTLASHYAKNLEEADERFVTNPIPTTAISVSHGQNDSGVFELSFQSERYLPFEGAGAISSWRLELSQRFRQFDYQTITDVVMHLRYTSGEGGDTLKTAALTHLDSYVGAAEKLSMTEGLFRMFSLPHEFPNEWHRLLNPEPNSTSQSLFLGNLLERMPFFAQSQQIESASMVEIRLFTQTEGLQMSLLKSSSNQTETLIESSGDVFTTTGPFVENLQQYVITGLSHELSGFWGIQFLQQDQPITKDQLSDAWLVIKYKIKLIP